MNTLQRVINPGMKIRDIVARNLRLMRKEHKLTQEQLGLISKVDRSYISMIERVVHNPTIEMLEKLAIGLGIEIEDFLKKDRRSGKSNARQDPPQP
jgi:transcriptional regulator with XRE-family HTH domain